jgi:transmembrane sensor
MNDADTTIEARARAWLLRLRSGKATSDDLQAFQRWCDEDPEHAAEARLLSETWSTLDTVMAEIGVEDAAAGRSGAARASAPRPGRRAFVGFAVATGAAWLALRPPLALWPALGDLAADYRTGTGDQRRIALSERVAVEMNTQTRINLLPVQPVQPVQASHGVDLLAGEVEVVAVTPAVTRSDAIRSVVVVAGKGRLQAQVAQFNVRRTGDTVCVTCVSGSIAFEHPQQRLTLLAAQQLVYDDRRVHPVTQVDPADTTAWRRGVLVFRGASLAQVVEEINRYRPGKLILRNAQLEGLQVQAQFSIARLDDAIAMICRYSGAHATELPGNIVLLG